LLLAGFGGLLLALVGPVPRLADHSLFSLHMTQLLLLTIVAPPLLLLGLPARLWAAIARHPALARSLKLWGHPVLGGGLFAASLVFWHLTPFFTVMMLSPGIHVAVTALFLVTALLAWWPVCCPLPEAGRIREPAQMIHLFLLGVPIQVLAAVITISGRVLYPWYGDAPRAFGLAPLADQQLGGLLLWVPGGLGLWVAITVVWLVWARRMGQRGAGGASGPGDEPPLTLPSISN
jgi:cytochrome c oxidase assembly factor CtaG